MGNRTEQDIDRTDDIERWYYGGTPPEGDGRKGIDHTPAQVETPKPCACHQATRDLLNRLRAATPLPML